MEESSINRESLMEVFLYETTQCLDVAEEQLLLSEKNNEISVEAVNEIFRMMHTIKGSAAMMTFHSIAAAAHGAEDLLGFIREKHAASTNYSAVYDIVLKTLDFIRTQIQNIQDGRAAEDSTELQTALKAVLSNMKNDKPAHNEARYEAKLYFEEGAGMENVRAFTIVHSLKEYCEELFFVPEDIIENGASSEEIAKNGFEIYFSSSTDKETLIQIFERALYVKSYEFNETQQLKYSKKQDAFVEKSKQIQPMPQNLNNPVDELNKDNKTSTERNIKQSLISVNISKLNKLMDFVGEIVIAQSMVIKNPDLEKLSLPNFNKASRQLRKLTDELQDIVMSIRMIPIASTFKRMERIVRDMSKQLNKQAELVILGEETEVDKNIIDHIADPLMHLIRNAVDHGLEMPNERALKGKDQIGKITLEAQNTGGDVMIRVSDDGQGLDVQKILAKAKKAGLINGPEDELSEKEIYSLIFLPGFSTNNEVTEFSGRGVGMDVVRKNIDEIGGSISVESMYDKGTTINIRIPLTLAIVGGMSISVGKSIYTLPTIAIREAFKADEKDIVIHPEGNEMIRIRDRFYNVIRLHKLFKEPTQITKLTEGIMLVAENGNKAVCLFADGLLDEQQVVVKALPPIFSKYAVKNEGIGGCVILGDGSISLMIDAVALIMMH